MNATSEQHIHAETVSLATIFNRAPDRLMRPKAADLARRNQSGERLSTPLATPSRSNALARMLNGLAEWVAALRERRTVSDELSRMSDRELADIGLNRAQINAVFDPVFSRERSVADAGRGGGCWPSKFHASALRGRLDLPRS